MKKLMISMVVLAGLAISVSSCSSTCKTCSIALLLSQKYCQKDFATIAEYNSAISTLEAAGYSCK
jgi:hypothetical protein